MTDVIQGTDTLQVEVSPTTESPPETTPEKVREEFTDPGQLEGRRNEPIKQHEPPVNSKRWNQIYWENKEKDRKIAELEKTLAEKGNGLQEKVIPEPIQTPSVTAPTQVNYQPPPVTHPITEAIDMEIIALRDKKMKAYEEMNLAEVSRCEDAISDMKEKRTIMISSFMSEQKTVNNFINTVEWLSPDSPKYDPVMAGAARYLDDEMMKTFNGSLHDRLIKVKDTIEKRFGYGAIESDKPKPPSTNQVKTGLNFVPPTVEGVINNLSSVKNVVLTNEQRAIARKMFPNNPDAEKIYAKNL